SAEQSAGPALPAPPEPRGAGPRHAAACGTIDVARWIQRRVSHVKSRVMQRGRLVLAASVAVCFFAVAFTAYAASGVAGAKAVEHVLVVVNRHTPAGFDHDFNVSAEDHQARGNINDSLLALPTHINANGVKEPVYDPTRLEGRLAQSAEFTNGGRSLV